MRVLFSSPCFAGDDVFTCRQGQSRYDRNEIAVTASRRFIENGLGAALASDSVYLCTRFAGGGGGGRPASIVHHRIRRAAPRISTVRAPNLFRATFFLPRPAPLPHPFSLRNFPNIDWNKDY